MKWYNWLGLGVSGFMIGWAVGSMFSDNFFFGIFYLVIISVGLRSYIDGMKK